VAVGPLEARPGQPDAGASGGPAAGLIVQAARSGGDC
jgi:hypothetical protein